MLADLIERNVAIKAAVVMSDEKETGERAHLNFGHTFAHAIEATVGYGTLLHGEAVALGMVAASALSERLGLIPEGVSKRLRAAIAACGLADHRAAALGRRAARGNGARQEECGRAASPRAARSSRQRGDPR